MTDPWTSGQQQPGPPPGGYPPYPPQQPYGQQPAPPYVAMPYPPPKKSHTAVIVTSVVGGVVVLVAAVCGITALVGGKAAVDDQNQARKDVGIVNCTTQQIFDTMSGVARIRVTNQSGRSASYSIEVAFESTDGRAQYDTAYASVSDLGPNQVSNVEADGFSAVQAGNLKCVVISVNRF